jgi:hypothetical protein
MLCIRGVFSWIAITALYSKIIHITKINIVQFEPSTCYSISPLKEAKDLGFTNTTPSRHKCQKTSWKER